MEGSSLISNEKGREDGSSLISSEKGKEKSGSSSFQLSVQLCLDWRGQKVYNYWNPSTGAPAGPDTTLRHVFMVQWEPPGHSLSFKQSVSFIILCLSYSFTLPAFFFFLNPSLSRSLSRWGPSISQTCYYNPTLAALHQKALKVWLAQYDGETGQKKKQEWSKRQRWEEEEEKKKRGEECEREREADGEMDNLEAHVVLLPVSSEADEEWGDAKH